MKRPRAYITAAWSDNEYENAERCAQYCRALFEAGYHPECPMQEHSKYIRDEIPEEYDSKLEMSRTTLRECDVLVVCGNIVDDIVKSDIAYAERRPLTATTLDGILTVKGLGRKI